MGTRIETTSCAAFPFLFFGMITLLVLYFWLLPLQFALSPAEGVDLPIARAAAALLIGGWLLGGLFSRSIRIAWDMRTGTFLTFFFLISVSVSVADETAWALRKWLFLASFLPLYFVMVDSFSRRAASGKIVAKYAVLGAACSALVGIVQFSLQWFVPIDRLFSWWTGSLLPFFLGNSFAAAVAEYPSLLVNLSGVTVMRASAFFPDPHMHAFYLGLCLPISFWFAWQKRENLWWCATLVIFVADLLTFSRGAYLGLSVAALAAWGLFGRRFSKNIRTGILFLASFVLVGLLIPNPVAERFWSGFSLEDGSVSSRIVLYEEAVHHIAERPWLGVGLGNYPLRVKPTADMREPIYVHNLWLDLAVEIGILGAWCLAGFFLLTMHGLYRDWKMTADSFSLALFGSLLIFFGHSLVEMPMFSVQVLPALLLIFALAHTRYADR